MKLLDGKATAAEIETEIAEKVKTLVTTGHKRPHLAAILVGEDGASHTYVNAKVRACERAGFASSLLHFEANLSEAELLEEVEKLNDDLEVDGFIVQLPLPRHINVTRVLEAVKPEKDVDGFHPVNVGRMVASLPTFLPATPNGIMELIRRNGVETKGKHAVVVGRSLIVGTPMAVLLSRDAQPGNCTVTLCHINTVDLGSYTRRADILVVAVGKPGLITADMVKEGAVVIDVGTTRVADANKKSGFALKGDVDYEAVAPKCEAISPVPGGVGPMTIASLLLNTLRAATHEVYPNSLADA